GIGQAGQAGCAGENGRASRRAGGQCCDVLVPRAAAGAVGDVTRAGGAMSYDAGFDKLGYLRILRAAKLTHAQYRVLVTILGYTDGDGGNAHPGYARLADECRMSKGTVSKCIAQLK